MKRISILVVLGLFLWAGMYLRFIDLDGKPMHTDEAVNGVMVLQSLSGEEVTFDPGHYHGPLLRYLAIPIARVVEWVSGRGFSEANLRWLMALAGGLTVLVLALYRRHMGWEASLIAMAVTAVSPPIVYYNRYFIHESLFVLFTLLFLHVLWRFVEERSWGLAVWTGMLAGLLHAVRETVVLVLAAAALALVVSGSSERWRWTFSREGLARLGVGALSAVLVSVFFYSAFFTYWQGVIDSILTYFQYSTEAGHEKPWYYYLGLIVGEKSRIGYIGQIWLLILGAAGIWHAFAGSKADAGRIRFYRFVAVYTLATTVLYSLISYKTPWLMLNFLVGWILLSGIGWVWLWGHFKAAWMRMALALVLVLLLGHSLRQSWWLGFRFSADPRNPFVYSHTSPDLLKLVDRIEGLAKLHPAGKGMRIDVAGIEYWPLPWYLREFTGVGYWAELPANSTAPVRIFSFTGDEDVPDLSDRGYTAELRGLRDGVFMLMYVENDLWESQFPAE